MLKYVTALLTVAVIILTIAVVKLDRTNTMQTKQFAALLSVAAGQIRISKLNTKRVRRIEKLINAPYFEDTNENMEN